MKLATRINSVLKEVNNDLLLTLSKIAEIDGITEVDLNYPEHFQNTTADEVEVHLEKLGLNLNGIALRFRSEFINGDLGNLDDEIHQKAMELAKNATDICERLGGKVITIWLGHDGFDYSFQLNYEKVWDRVVKSIQELADYNPNIQFSIEYKPFEERSYALIDSVGTTLYMISEINRENVGATLDYCHMLMKHENPAYGLALVGKKGKLMGMHINDGYGFQDNGLMIGSASLFQTLEFLYYCRKYSPDLTVYFDTFPIREKALEEIQQNVKMFKLLNDKIDKIGMDEIEKVINQNSGIAANKLFYKFLEN